MTALPMAVAMALAIAGCCRPTVVRQPVAVQSAPCLDALPPDPPAIDAGDQAWQAYHINLEGWTALVVRSCGSHMTDDDRPAAGIYGE